MLLTAILVLFLASKALAKRLIESKYLSPCMKNSQLAATLFHAVFTPDNRTVSFRIQGDSQVASNVDINFIVSGYGYTILNQNVSPCSSPNLKSLCPMTAGNLPDITSNFEVPKSEINRIPSITYYIPDLDGNIRVWLNSTQTKKPLACVETEVSNGKTVFQAAISWVLALLTACFVISSMVLWRRGFHASALHIYTKALCMVNYFQALAMFGELIQYHCL